MIVTLSLLVMIGLDQLTKWWAYTHLQPQGSISLLPFFRLTYLENRGAAFGIMYGFTWLLSVATIGILLFLIYYYLKQPKGKPYTYLKVCLVLMGAGGAGNLIDRLFRGFVIDFFHVILGSYHFPVFNVADIFVVMGTIGFAVLTLFVKELR